MILLLFAAPSIFGVEVNQSFVGHSCAGYFMTDMYLELGFDKNDSMTKRYMKAFCITYLIGFTKEMYDKQDGTDLLAVITGSVFNITFDWIFNRDKHKRRRR